MARGNSINTTSKIVPTGDKGAIKKATKAGIPKRKPARNSGKNEKR